MDWFRRPPEVPPGWTPFGWLAYCEACLLRFNLGDGLSGTVFIRRGGPWVSIDWRCDDGIMPAVVRAANDV